SQPSESDFKMAKEAGMKTVINLRKEGELKDFDQAAVMAELGFDYHHFGYRAPDELTDELLDSVRGLLNDKSKYPILLHCSSGNRTGAVWLAHRVLDHGMAWDEALAEARTSGLKMPAYETKVADYLKRKQSK